MRQLWEYAIVVSAFDNSVRHVSIQYPITGVVKKEGKDYFKILNEMGKEGWEAVSFVFDPDNEYINILMKREQN